MCFELFACCAGRVLGFWRLVSFGFADCWVVGILVSGSCCAYFLRLA